LKFDLSIWVGLGWRVKTHYKWTTFVPKKWCIPSKLKSWFHPLANLNTSKRNLKICTTTKFGIQSSLWVKINLDPTIKWGGLNKINVHRVYNLQFFNNHKDSCLWFMKHYQTKEIEKIMQCPYIKYAPLWYGSDFFLKWRYYHAFIVFKKWKKTLFLMEIHPKVLNFLNF